MAQEEFNRTILDCLWLEICRRIREDVGDVVDEELSFKVVTMAGQEFPMTLLPGTNVNVAFQIIQDVILKWPQDVCLLDVMPTTYHLVEKNGDILQGGAFRQGGTYTLVVPRNPLLDD